VLWGMFVLKKEKLTGQRKLHNKMFCSLHSGCHIVRGNIQYVMRMHQFVHKSFATGGAGGWSSHSGV
jgi:hypothetical protein